MLHLINNVDIMTIDHRLDVAPLVALSEELYWDGNAVCHQRHQSPDVDDEREEVAAVSPTMETNGSSSGRHITQHPKTAPTTTSFKN